MGGEYAGMQHWHTQPMQGGFQTRVETQFEGILPTLRQTQVSHYGPGFVSVHFAEQEGSSGPARGKMQFEVHFDDAAGLVTLRQGREQTQAALLTPYHDPVSLLMLLRSPAAPREPWQASMTGGRVHVQPLEADGASRRYILRPGGAAVWVENEPPYRILYLAQPTDFGMVEARLEAVTEREAPKVRRRVK